MISTNISLRQLAASSTFIDSNTPVLICGDVCDDTLPAAIAAGHIATSEAAAGHAPDWSALRAQVAVHPLACACACACGAVSQRDTRGGRRAHRVPSRRLRLRRGAGRSPSSKTPSTTSRPSAHRWSRLRHRLAGRQASHRCLSPHSRCLSLTRIRCRAEATCRHAPSRPRRRHTRPLPRRASSAQRLEMTARLLLGPTRSARLKRRHSTQRYAVPFSCVCPRLDMSRDENGHARAQVDLLLPPRSSTSIDL